MKLTLGYSPCPNDTFIFDAWVNNKIDTDGLEVEVVLEDVQTLNEWAQEGRLDISKISYGVLPLVLQNYTLLHAGGALGKGVGPLLITNNEGKISNDEVNTASIAIPGKNTTAHMLFSLAYPKATQKRFMVFNEIEDAVLQHEVDAGVIIHENRFTYAEKGLVKLADLGDYWEKETGYPIPLGGIVMKKEFDTALQQQVNTLIRRSCEYAFAYYPHISDYVKQYAQEMNEDVMRRHIDLYVNDYSLDLGAAGKAAVLKFMDIYKTINNTTTPLQPVF